MTQTISWTQQCEDCKGIGLYQGMGEREGASVVCKGCRGTGRAAFHQGVRAVRRTQETGRHH